MNPLIGIVLLIVVVLLYLNAQEQFLQGRDLEIYEIDYDNKYGLHRILKKRQPVLFQMKGVVIPDNHYLHDLSLEKFAQKYGKERVYLSNDEATMVKPVPLKLNKALDLLKEDNETVYLSHHNQRLVAETSIQRYLSTLEEYICPSFTTQKRHDFVFGSPGATTPLSYHEHQCTFLYVAQGQMTIKMTPIKNHVCPPDQQDRSRGDGFVYAPHNPVWTPGYDDAPLLEFPVPAGWVLYVPPFWWHSYRLDPTDRTIVTAYHYTTLMNTVIQARHWINNLLGTYDRLPKKERKTEQEEEQEPEEQEVDRPINTSNTDVQQAPVIQ